LGIDIKLKAISQFLGVGFIGFCVDALIFFTVINFLNSPLALGRALASTVAISSTWLLNRRVTFAHKKSTKLLNEWLRYSFASLIGALANFLTLFYVSPFDAEFYHIPAYLFGTAAGLVVNFILYQTIVFTSPKSTQ